MSTGDGHIQRIYADLSGRRPTLATDAVGFPAGQRALGLAFGPSGHLFAGSSNGGIKRYRVEGEKLVEPVDYGSFNGTATDLGSDVEGRLFIAEQVGTTSKPLLQIPPSGVGVLPVVEIMGRLSSLTFGRGGFDCHDLFVTDAGGVTHRWLAPQPGLGVRDSAFRGRYEQAINRFRST